MELSMFFFHLSTWNNENTLSFHSMEYHYHWNEKNSFVSHSMEECSTWKKTAGVFSIPWNEEVFLFQQQKQRTTFLPLVAKTRSFFTKSFVKYFLHLHKILRKILLDSKIKFWAKIIPYKI